MRILSILFFSLNCFFSLVLAQDPTQSPQRLETSIKLEMDYLLALPKGYDEQESWPLVLFLHGAGERGDNLDLVKKHGPPKLVAAGKDLPFIVVSPQCPSGKWWQPTELTALLDQIENDYKVDKDRIYVTGLSMGGFGTWQLAAYTPNRFAAIAPICGGGEPYWSKQISHIPTWAFHGAMDFVVPVHRSQEMVFAMQARGGEPKLTIYADAGHDSWTETYNNPEFFDWLLEQKRESAE